MYNSRHGKYNPGGTVMDLNMVNNDQQPYLDKGWYRGRVGACDIKGDKTYICLTADDVNKWHIETLDTTLKLNVGSSVNFILDKDKEGVVVFRNTDGLFVIKSNNLQEELSDPLTLQGLMKEIQNHTPCQIVIHSIMDPETGRKIWSRY